MSQFLQINIYMPPAMVEELDHHIAQEILRTGHHVSRADVIREIVRKYLTPKERKDMQSVLIERTPNGLLGHDEEGYTLPLIEQHNNTPQEVQMAGFTRLNRVFPKARVFCPPGTDLDPRKIWIANDDLSPGVVQEIAIRLAQVADEREKHAMECDELLELFVQYATDATLRADETVLEALLERYRRLQEN